MMAVEAWLRGVDRFQCEGVFGESEIDRCDNGRCPGACAMPAGLDRGSRSRGGAAYIRRSPSLPPLAEPHAICIAKINLSLQDVLDDLFETKSILKRH